MKWLALFKRKLPTEISVRREIIALYEELKRRLEELTRQLEKDLASGADASLKQAQAMMLVTQLEALVSHYAQQVSSRVEMGRRKAAAAGIQQGSKALRKVGVKFAQPDLHAIEALARELTPTGRLFDLFASFGPDAAAKAKQTILVGLGTGQGAKQIAKQLREDLQTTATRSLLIVTDQINRAQREGNLVVFRQNAAYLDGWRWTAAKSSRTCAMCLAMDGTIHPLTESLDSHPSCRCVPTPLVKGADHSKYETGAQWFDRQSHAVQREILGPTKHELYKAGKLKLSDLVQETHHPVWGRGRREAPLTALLATRKVGKRALANAAKVARNLAAAARRPRVSAIAKVSEAFTLAKTGRIAQESAEALKSIDAVHLDGDFRAMEIRTFVSAKSDGGFIMPAGGGPDIRINSKSQDVAFTLAHEIGHAIDIEAYGAGLASVVESDPAFDAFRTAVVSSRNFDFLARNHSKGMFYYMQGRLTPDGIEALKFFDYLLRWEELWARGYAQYIAVESQDAAMLASLGTARSLPVPDQWEDSDFTQIHNAVDGILRHKGWK